MTTMRNDDLLPKVEKSSPIKENVQRKYDKLLRHHFLYGSKISDNTPKNPFQVLPTFETGKSIDSQYPIVYDPESLNIQSLKSVILKMINKIFNKEEKATLIQALHPVFEQFHKRIISQNMAWDCKSQITELISGLRDKVDLIKNQDNFDKNCNQLYLQLSNYSKYIIGFSSHTLFQFINLKLIQRKQRNIEFLEMLNEHISGLAELLLLHDKRRDTTDKQMDFASNLISFDQISEIELPAVSSGLSDSRLNRLKKCLNLLQKAKERCLKDSTTIFISEELNKEYSIEKKFCNAVIEVDSEEVCKKARQAYKIEISKFVKIIKALRIAKLEINQQYNDNYHDIYFEKFDLPYLGEEDSQYFRTLIILEKSQNLVTKPNDLLALLSDDAIVKVLSINNVREISAFENKQRSEAFQDIVSMALFQRNTNIYQGGTEDAQWLNEAFTKGLEASKPVLWNIITCDPESNYTNRDFSTVKTAVDSRFFPRFIYQVTSTQSFGERFNLEHNLQPSASLPSYQKDIISLSGITRKEYKLTMADFFAMNEKNLQMLEILPSGYTNAELLVLDEYLLPKIDDVSKKIPFIWLIDERQILKRACVPMSWISRCRTSLDFWEFLLELSGMSHHNLTLEIEKLKSAWDAQKKVEMETLNQELKLRFEIRRRDDLEYGIKRILNALVDGRYAIPNKTNHIESIPEIKVDRSNPAEQGNSEIETEEIKSEPVLESINPEAWVESNECTSCNDCIDALPTVFKYNSNKQAFVHNPKGGPYSKIVAAAEKCPAACIHPGLPQDSKERGLEKLRKRAEKFN
ncbi:MAG: ferredoxin [Saprospiraceae bacterium]|nr:ferredoxin [Saprospiraceae bacterium]